MKEQAGLIYEVTLCIDRDIATDVDHWLTAHIEEMLLLPGFIHAKTFALDDEPDRVRRVTHYYLENDAALEQYLAGPATSMRQATVEKFGERFDASRRVLQPTNADEPEPPEPPEACLNCGAALAGQYCANCGQRANSRLISVWELIRDAFGDLLELDSRIWQTLIPLAIRPGQLTRDYLRGRRARFMPPFRTYLVLSVLFFLVAFFDPQETLSILFEAEPAASPAQVEEGALTRQEFFDELADRTETSSHGGVKFSLDGIDVGESCQLDDFDESEMPAWLGRRLTKERLKVMCDRMIAQDGAGLRGFADKMLENVPAGLFILLPLMALILNILYPLSKRYYVEHLLFVIHYHAFFFLALITQILSLRLAALIGLSERVDKAIVSVFSIYIVVYLYRAMRRVYEQGHWATVPKFIILLIAYMTGLSLILAVAAIFAAFSI
ncbi:MAG: DUF4286 family protein [Gammaproteobacteria bacterium]|nr:DUF4286 family protein [Gammaproteobacteria bacterium]